MSKKKLLMIDLKEEKSKNIAKAIGSKTCRKILELLADKEYTASELAKKLSMPLSTIHYNLSQLVSTGLVISEEYHYSKKMKEVLHYKLANQYIIIAPQNTDSTSFREKIEKFLPVIAVSAVGGLFIYFYESILSLFSRSTADAPSVLAMTEDVGVMQEARAVETMVQTTEPNLAFWFLLGSFVAVFTFVVVDYLGSNWRKKK